MVVYRIYVNILTCGQNSLFGVPWRETKTAEKGREVLASTTVSCFDAICRRTKGTSSRPLKVWRNVFQTVPANWKLGWKDRWQGRLTNQTAISCVFFALFSGLQQPVGSSAYIVGCLLDKLTLTRFSPTCFANTIRHKASDRMTSLIPVTG
jgi:hypothetical protein